MSAKSPKAHAPLSAVPAIPVWFRLLPLFISVAVIIADRVTKWAIQKSLSPLDTIVVIPGCFSLIHTENRGVAFGLFSDLASPWREVILVGLSLVALAVVVKILWGLRPESGEFLTLFSLSLILGGAIGNLYDRILFGAVPDFLLLYAGQYQWPAFNVADTSITIGAGLLLVQLWRSHKSPVQKGNAQTA